MTPLITKCAIAINHRLPFSMNIISLLFRAHPTYRCLQHKSPSSIDPITLDTQQPNDRKMAVPQQMSAALAAFTTRTGINFGSIPTLMQALTHKSYKHGQVPTNERLQFIGTHVLNLYVTEYVNAKYPNLPPPTLFDAVNAYTSFAILSDLGRNFGVQDVMRWLPSDVNKTGESSIIAKTTKALIGAMYHDKGALAARKFIHATLLSRDLDMTALLNLKEPKRILYALLKRKDRELPVSRMMYETGRHSTAPVFVVGVFSGTKKLGEGAGSSIKMAEHRAAKDALIKYYLFEISKPLLPSDTEGLPEEEALTFRGTELGDTPPVI